MAGLPVNKYSAMIVPNKAAKERLWRENMHGLPSRARTQGTVPVPTRVALGAKPHRSVVHKILAVGLVGAVYALIGVVMSEAYREFGQQSLRNFPPLVLADRAPLKLLPGEVDQEDTSPPDRTRSEPSDALAPGPDDPASPDSQIVPAIAPSPNDERGSPADPLGTTERRAMVRHAGDSGNSAQGSVAVPQMAAAPPPAGSTDASAQTAVADPPPPAPA